MILDDRVGADTHPEVVAFEEDWPTAGEQVAAVPTAPVAPECSPVEVAEVSPLQMTMSELYEAGEIGTRTHNRLGELTLGDLARMTEAELLATPPSGPRVSPRSRRHSRPEGCNSSAR